MGCGAKKTFLLGKLFCPSQVAFGTQAIIVIYISPIWHLFWPPPSFLLLNMFLEKYLPTLALAMKSGSKTNKHADRQTYSYFIITQLQLVMGKAQRLINVEIQSSRRDHYCQATLLLVITWMGNSHPLSWAVNPNLIHSALSKKVATGHLTNA